jgi:hypothetical protein
METPIFRITAKDLAQPLWLEKAEADTARTLYWSDDWSAEFYVALARAGFISTAIEYSGPPFLLLPELQDSYAVLDWDRLHVDRSVRSLISGTDLNARSLISGTDLKFSLTSEVGPVLEAISAFHVPSWLHPPYLELMLTLSKLQSEDFRLVATELRETSTTQLVAGELGYFCGATYTSLTGFFNRTERRWNNFGKLQMVLLAYRLQDLGVAFWNLGHPHMPYKVKMGARILSRAEFLNRWKPAVV